VGDEKTDTPRLCLQQPVVKRILCPSFDVGERSGAHDDEMITSFTLQNFKVIEAAFHRNVWQFVPPVALLQSNHVCFLLPKPSFDALQPPRMLAFPTPEQIIR